MKEFLELNWFNVHDKCLQFIVSDISKFYNNQCLDYFNEVFCSALLSLVTKLKECKVYHM